MNDSIPEKQLGSSALRDATVMQLHYRIDNDPESECTTLGKFPTSGVRCTNE